MHGTKSRPESRFSPSVVTRCLIHERHGYALPSILFLVVILTTVALSVFSLGHFRRLVTLKAVQTVKAEYAAQSGIAVCLSAITGIDQLRRFSQFERIEFEESGYANVRVDRWGAYYLVTSEGYFGNATSRRVALVGDYPGPELANALIFANDNHQLVLAGSSSLKGDVIVGSPGLSIGMLKSVSSGRTVPVFGTVKKQHAPTLPAFKANEIIEDIQTINAFSSGFNGNAERQVVINALLHSPVVLNEEIIPPEIQHASIRGDAIFDGSLTRRDLTLLVAVNGKATFRKNAKVEGLVKILAQDSIVVPANVALNHAILYSRTSIEVWESAAVTAQLIAPSIDIRRGAKLGYPSFLLSAFDQVSSQSPATAQVIKVSAGARVEGMVIALVDETKQTGSVIIQPGGRVVGAIYTNGKVTHDGILHGTMMTKDFYFYESPTTYFGWLRGGIIDRTLLPESFLTPIGFDKTPKLEVLDWL